MTAGTRLRRMLGCTGVATTLAWSQSDISVFDYEVANVGGAFSLSFKF